MRQDSFPPTGPQTAAAPLRALEFLPPKGTTWPPLKGVRKDRTPRREKKLIADDWPLTKGGLNFDLVV